MVQVLRLTIAMARPDARIVAAAQDVAGACRRAAASLAGSRADFPSLQAVALDSVAQRSPSRRRGIRIRRSLPGLVVGASDVRSPAAPSLPAA